MSKTDSIASDIACLATALLFAAGLIVLSLKLWDVQVTGSAGYSYESSRQSERRVQTSGERGCIFDRNGVLLAGNRTAFSIVCDAARYQRRTWDGTVDAVWCAVSEVYMAIGREPSIDKESVRRHIKRSPSMPISVWRDIDYGTLAKFSEREEEFPGFSCCETEERVYPNGSLAAHLLGYVGRDRGEAEAGDEKFNFFMPEMRGRAGLEVYYDSFLRGVGGERKILVDARGFAIREWTVVESRKGPDLELTIDARLQAVVERELSGHKGACAVIDPRNGEVLAMASAPGFNPNDFVPILRPALYARYAKDPSEPLLNRASGGAYAPGSTFKPITALAGLSSGFSPSETHDCDGVFELGLMRLHCSSRWGHGPVDMRHALMKSCNPYFCSLAMSVGTNAVMSAARAFGLGSKTGLDLGVDMAGVVPDAGWKSSMYHERWYQGDLAQMSIGQGMLLVSPLQMARVAGALGTGMLATPRLKKGLSPELRRVPFSNAQLAVVREGMRMVVAGDGSSRGTGWRAGEGVAAEVCGKTGTAEIGRGATRRKNTWFIAYAPAVNPTVAVAMVIENGESGGGTTAPKVGTVLKAVFGESGRTGPNADGG